MKGNRHMNYWGLDISRIDIDELSDKAREIFEQSDEKSFLELCYYCQSIADINMMIAELED